ncbi:MAG: ACP phosphodiesterase [Bacteroidota bacterium]
MNFLGHLYFSNNDKVLMLNNLFGDFVKGKDLSFYPKEVQKGIHLHREIDNFIDHHPKVLELTHKLFADLPKVSGIAIDLFFDHLLAKHWNTFHQKELNEFLNDFYVGVNTKQTYYSDEFKYMISKMIEVNWISYYPRLEGLEKACQGVSIRLSFDNKLKFGKEVFLKFEKEIESTFFEFMKDAKVKFNV